MNLENNKFFTSFVLCLTFSALIHLFFYLFFIKKLDFSFPKEEIVEITLEEKREKDNFKEKVIIVKDTKRGNISDQKERYRPSRYISKFFRVVEEEMVAEQKGNQLINEHLFEKMFNKETENTALFPNGVSLGSISGIDFNLPNVKKGVFTALNTNAFKFYAFIIRMLEQVLPRSGLNLQQYIRIMTDEDIKKFINQIRQSPLDLKIEVILSPNGHHEQSIIHKSFGFKELDHSITDAFEEASPLLNPPKELIAEDGKIHLSFGVVLF